MTVKREAVETIREDDADSTESWIDRHTINISVVESQRLCSVCSHSFIPSLPVHFSPMSFWKPGEAYPDGMEQKEDVIPVERTQEEEKSHRRELSEATKSLPVFDALGG